MFALELFSLMQTLLKSDFKLHRFAAILKVFGAILILFQPVGLNGTELNSRGKRAWGGGGGCWEGYSPPPQYSDVVTATMYTETYSTNSAMLPNNYDPHMPLNRMCINTLLGRENKVHSLSTVKF